MIEHLLLPYVDFENLELITPHKEWLEKWLNNMINKIEDKIVSTSLCLQGAIAEILLYQELKTDWTGIIQSYLKDENSKPLAYSEEFGKLLYKYNQWKQTTVHAIYSQWWLDNLYGTKGHEEGYSDFIEELIQSNGWIYNPNVSVTQIRTRMKSEIMMSLSMGLEIICSYKDISNQKKVFEAALCSIPATGYLSAEYFRLRALSYLHSEELAPVVLSDMLQYCEAGYGYCDFSIESKVDDYMGSAKKISRDEAVHSAISSLHANFIAKNIDGFDNSPVLNKIREFGKHLSANYFDIPSFTMRDIKISFGTDISPLELMAASYIINECKK
jgi:hypothetical protein